MSRAKWYRKRRETSAKPANSTLKNGGGGETGPKPALLSSGGFTPISSERKQGASEGDGGRWEGGVYLTERWIAARERLCGWRHNRPRSTNCPHWSVEEMPPGNNAAAVFKPEARSAITNGSVLLPDVDGRSLWVRRFRDLLALHLDDLGGADIASEAQKAIARRAACLIVELERLEQRFATQGASEGGQLDQYQRVSNTLRRLLESLGLERRQRDVTPGVRQYVAVKAAAAE